jgi:monooxygenase
MTRTAPATASQQATMDVRDAGHVEVLIVGAGVSGIGAAHHLQVRFPNRTFVILDPEANGLR